jgi:hypothetical protein
MKSNLRRYDYYRFQDQQFFYIYAVAILIKEYKDVKKAIRH